MPIKIQDGLPAVTQLESENIFVMTEFRAMHQDIRPLRIAILNLMPKKIETETQLSRILGNTQPNTTYFVQGFVPRFPDFVAVHVNDTCFLVDV